MADTKETGDHEEGQTGNRESWAGAAAENADVQAPRNEKLAPAARDAVDRLKHFKDADAELKLTDQERELYAHHLNNLSGTGRYDHGDGSVSTVFGETREVDGRTYLIPRVHEGSIVDSETAMDLAKMRGLDRHPSYASQEEAEARYRAIHDFMDRDVEDDLHRREGPDSELRRRYLSHRVQAPPGLMEQ